MVEISAVVPTHNRVHVLAPLIESLLGSRVVPDEVIVVDNASSDGTAERIGERFPSVVCIRNPRNYFVAKACNIGIAASTGKFILVVADDNVLHPECIGKLHETFLSHEDAAVVGPRMFYYDAPDRPWFTAVSMSLWTGRTHFSRMPPSRQAFTVAGGVPNCLMIRRSALEEVGPFDDQAFPFHNEEADLYFRCRKAGYSTYVRPDATEWHRVPLPILVNIGTGDFNVDDPVRSYLHARARPLLVRRHATAFQRTCYFAAFFPATTIAYCLVAFTSGKRGLRLKNAAAFFQGSLAGATMKMTRPPDPLKKLPLGAQGYAR